MSFQISELLHPIGEDNAGGTDVRYEPVFDQIKRARIEEDDLPAGDWSRERKTADYALVVKLATEVLSKRSKDLQVAAWLTEAALKRDGFTGLRAGLELLEALVDRFWDHLYPQIEDGDMEFRAAPLEWVAQYLEPSVRMMPVTMVGDTMFVYHASRMVGYEKDADSYEKKEAREAALQEGKPSAEMFDESVTATPKAWYKQIVADIDGSLTALDGLDRLGQEKLLDLAPRYTPLRNALADLRQVAAPLLAMKLELEPDPVEPEPEFDGGVETVSEGGQAAAVTMSATPRSRADAESRITAAARYLRAQNPKDPAPYLLLRGFRWGELRVQGSTIEPKLLAAPPTELRSNLRGLLLDGQWARLLEAGEEVMASPYGRGWLDLQRYVLTACHGLGTEYDHVVTAIRGALRALFLDLPQLPSLVLMDDTPTANAETQAWLREQALASELAVDASPVALASDGRAGRGITERAMERVRAGEPEKAVELLIRQAAQERSPRERFLRRSEAAAIMTDTGREAVAMPILEELLQEIDEHGLEKWEAGDTVAHTLGLMYRCMRRLQGDSSSTEQLYLRICRLDPLKAIQIGGAQSE
jgi:type VI secretion system protein ImpA